mmetsp:Transcript_27264/g.26312  ORF Transcript_27264/g.26312 Transcript_27264/m.26312 type:complete len:132 (+) Transcript_27264:138-533(+)
MTAFLVPFRTVKVLGHLVLILNCPKDTSFMVDQRNAVERPEGLQVHLSIEIQVIIGSVDYDRTPFLQGQSEDAGGLQGESLPADHHRALVIHGLLIAPKLVLLLIQFPLEQEQLELVQLEGFLYAFAQLEV